MPAAIEVFYQPGKVFERLRDRPNEWPLPLAADVAVAVANVAVVTKLVGLETIVRQRLQNSNMPPEQMQRALDRMASPATAYLGYAGALVSTILIVLAISAALAVFGMMTKDKPKFASMFSMVSLAMLPYGLISFAMTTAVILLAPDRASLDFTNLLATNPGAFLDKATTSKFLYSLLSSLDLLSLLAVGMLAYGFAKVTRAGLGSGWGAVLSLWLLLIVSRAMASSLF
jgi:hypothetical protein